jgi:hypothetical protein
MAGDMYATTYCNRPHDVTTGRPIGHECYILSPKGLQAERRGDHDTASEEFQGYFDRHGHVAVRGRDRR